MDLDTQDRMMPFASKSHDVFSEGPPIQTIGESLQGAYQEEERQVRTRRYVMDDVGLRPLSHITSRVDKGIITFAQQVWWQLLLALYAKVSCKV